MNCCSQGAQTEPHDQGNPAKRDLQDEVLLSSRPVGEDLWQTGLSVPSIHCGGCIRAIESALGDLPEVDAARVNLSTKRVTVRWRGKKPPPLVETLTDLGYEAYLSNSGVGNKDQAFTELLRALAVAGFAATNIMLLSFSVWFGADAVTRDLFHWLSAAVAVPVLLYSARIFFRSAWQALRHGRTNMDVPISIGVALAFGLSLYDTAHGGDQAYFEASTSLVFFLLIGRTLDQMMRERVRSAIKGLGRLSARGARVVRKDDSTIYLPLSDICPGMMILLVAGERVPVDARVERGTSEIDGSIVSGESVPFRVVAGSDVKAGMLNLIGPLWIRATATAENSFLAEMVRLMEVAEGGRARYRRIADRASQLYAPVVHVAAMATFLGWMVMTGDWHRAVSVAIAVLIITCPCALGLAVPIVQVIAARRLFEHGVMVKDGSAMERLAEIDTVVFDKTGTLTTGEPRLVNLADIPPAELHLAAAIAVHSRHPQSKTLAALGRASGAVSSFQRITEIPGFGIEAVQGDAIYRLGRAEWALERAEKGGAAAGTILARDGHLLACFFFEDRRREAASETVGELIRSGLRVELLTGDHATAAAKVATDLNIPDYQAGVLPHEKLARICALALSGRKVLMVGDGLNDVPALAAAHVSIAPGTGADLGRNAADFVFLHESLAAISLALTVSRRAGHLIRQNLGLAIAYNAVAVPVAILGYVTPLIAALAMSSSSLIVVANAFRLGQRVRPGLRAPATAHQSAGANATMVPAE